MRPKPSRWARTPCSSYRATPKVPDVAALLSPATVPYLELDMARRTLSVDEVMAEAESIGISSSRRLGQR
jgi:hypothetical protein